MPGETLPGYEKLNSGSSETNALQFLFRQLMTGVWTATVVQVMAVTNADTVDPVGFCDVNPLVHQIDGDGKATPHGIIRNLPYFRYQGGRNAIIMDPEVGDIGLVVHASRDISAVKSTKGPNVPGSWRRHDPADGLYIGGFLNGVPTQYILFSPSAIVMLSPTQIKLQAPDIQFIGPTHTTGAVTGDATAVYAGEVTANGGHTVSQHTHTQGNDSHGDTEVPTNTPTG